MLSVSSGNNINGIGEYTIMEDQRYEEETKNDRIIIKMLPYLVVICFMAGILNIVFRMSDKTVGSVLVRFCEAFVVGFMLLGLYSYFKAGKPIVKNKIPLFLFAIGPVAVAAVSFILGELAMPDIFESELFQRSDDLGKDILVSAGKIYLVMFMAISVVYGVESVVSSYFRQYVSRVYRYIEKLKNDGTDGRKGNFTLKLYDVPEIIDIQSVEMDPIEREKRFPMEDFISMSFSIFALGLIICSYIFLNPVFMQTMTIYETMMIGILISFFIPVLIMPWYITRETGTKVKSQARDLYLWKGMKKRMYQSFFAFTMVLFLILITLYLGSDMMRITYTYIGYAAFLMFMSIIYSFTFFNRYNTELKDGIIRKFEESGH